MGHWRTKYSPNIIFPETFETILQIYKVTYIVPMLQIGSKYFVAFGNIFTYLLYILCYILCNYEIN